jgi:outer membrane protein assembly factor BamE (lipoprotein component of BamABCDE complex)
MRNVRSGFYSSSIQKAKWLFSPVRAAGLAACLSTVLLSGCLTETTSIHGQITEGASREQVMLTLGTPSTTADFGGEVFYYISQTRKQPVAFMRSYPVDQTVVAVYFDDEQRVSRTARYGLKDGKLFDFSRQVTPTGGKDTQFLSRLVEGIGAGVN